MTPQQARQVLKAPTDCTPETLAKAFRSAVKAAHPDLGGDAERLRLVIQANEVLKTAPQPPQPRPVASPAHKPDPDRLEITVEEALLGGRRRVETAAGPAQVALPAGLRAGETLRVTRTGQPDLLLRIAIADGPEISIRGDDLWMRASTPGRQARLEIDTPRGRRSVWLSPKVGSKRIVRLSGEGLPARAGRPAGDLILRLDAAAPAPDSPARQMLRRFAGTWAAA